MHESHDRSPPPLLPRLRLSASARPRWLRCLCGEAARARRMPRAMHDPLAPKQPHFPGRRPRRVIHLFMAGAPSQLDLFDYKPELAQARRQAAAARRSSGQRYAFIRPDAGVLGPRFKFAKHGQCGAELSEMLPHLAKVVDDIAHPQSGPHRPVQPRAGADLLQHRLRPAGPAEHRVAGCSTGWAARRRTCRRSSSCPPARASAAARRTGRAASCPTIYTGVRFRNQGDPILNVSSRRPASMPRLAAATRST